MMVVDISTPNYISKPITFEQFVGNPQVKQILSDNIDVTLKKCGAFPHTLIHGMSGGGKTSLMNALAAKLNTTVTEINCGVGNINLINTLLKIPDRGILFLDEIHSLDISTIENLLYRFMDSGTVFIRYPDGRVEPFDVGRNITIAAATTEIDKLPTPLLNRFTLNLKLKPYSHDEMCQILKLYLKKHLTVDDAAISILANATRYVPRHAVQFSQIIKNYALQHDLTTIDSTNMIQALSNMGIDQHGFDDFDRDYIHLLYHTFNNMPTGLSAITSMLGDSKKTIEEKENWLIREGILIRTNRGRMLSPAGLRIAMDLKY